MVKTRTSKSCSQPYRHTRPSNTDDVLDELLIDLSETNKDAEILVPISDKILKYENNLSGNSFIIVGPASSGKESHVLWLARDINQNIEGVETNLITIDCRIYETDTQFLNALTRDLRTFFGESVLSKHIIINESASINFTGLNKQFEKLRKKQLLLIIKSAQILAAHQRKQKILYNICEWLNNTDAKKYITIVLLTKNIMFLDKLEKRTKSRMNMPIVYLPKIKPKEVIQIIRKRIQYRIDRSNKKNGQVLQKLLNALENNKELMKVLEEQYDFCPRDAATYLKMMKLIITLGIKTVSYLQLATQGQINSIITQGFTQYLQYSTDYKLMAKNLYINLPRPDILLLGFIRQRLINQQNRKGTEITLKILMQDYNTIRQKKNIMEGGVFCNYQQKVLEDALLRLQEQNFVTVAKQENMQLLERGIVSQYSPDDMMYFYKEYLKHDYQVPSFIKEIYTTEIYHES